MEKEEENTLGSILSPQPSLQVKAYKVLKKKTPAVDCGGGMS
jgi:hypothetical protein